VVATNVDEVLRAPHDLYNVWINLEVVAD